MRNPGGYAIITDPDSAAKEFDTITCRHCSTVVHLKAAERPEDCGGFCTLCAKAICAECVGKPCDPFEKKLERAEARYHARRSYGLVA